MSDFWWGVLALPLIVLGVAVLVGTVLGTWLLAEHWAKGRTAEMNFEPDWQSTAYRRTPAAWVLAAPKMRRFKLGFGCALLYVRGMNRVEKTTWQRIERAVSNSINDVDKELYG